MDKSYCSRIEAITHYKGVDKNVLIRLRARHFCQAFNGMRLRGQKFAYALQLLLELCVGAFRIPNGVGCIDELIKASMTSSHAFLNSDPPYIS